MIAKTLAVLAALLLIGLSPAPAADRCGLLGRELLAITAGSDGLSARYRASAERQRAAIATAEANARRAGCGRLGPASADCRIITATMERMRRNLASLETMAGGSGGAARTARAGEIRAQMRDLGCARPIEPAGPAVRTRSVVTKVPAMALVPRADAPRSERAINYALFPAGRSYRTLCVRLCDGYYFPISWAVRPSGFATDDWACQTRCPGAETQLFVHPTGTESEVARSVVGQPWSRLPTAFLYRKTRVEGCGCGRPAATGAGAGAGTPLPGPLLRELTLPPITRPPEPEAERPQRGAASPGRAASAATETVSFETSRFSAGLDLTPSEPDRTVLPSPVQGR